MAEPALKAKSPDFRAGAGPRISPFFVNMVISQPPVRIQAFIRRS